MRLTRPGIVVKAARDAEHRFREPGHLWGGGFTVVLWQTVDADIRGLYGIE
jgi:hypothetical protein